MDPGDTRPMVIERSEFDLCIGCGMCSSICKKGALGLKEDDEGLFKPVLTREKCNGCGLCDAVCPILNGDPEGGVIGSSRGSYLAHAKDDRNRWAGASGGVVTSLMSFLLEEKPVEAILAVRGDEEGSPFPTAGWVRSFGEVTKARGSRYCTVPVNLELSKLPEGDGSLAFVGLPCQVRALRFAQRKDATLRRRIPYIIGLFCGGNSTPGGTRVLLERIGLNPEDVREVHFRGEGWPGIARVEMKDGSVRNFDRELYRSLLFTHFFTPMACAFCQDGTSELADISVGDPWLPELKDEKSGKSIAVARSERGLELLESAEREGFIALELLSKEKVISSQLEQLTFKKGALRARLNFLSATSQAFRASRLRTELDRITTRKQPSFFAILFSSLPFFNRRLGTNPHTRRLIGKIPLLMLRLYHRGQSGLIFRGSS